MRRVTLLAVLLSALVSQESQGAAPALCEYAGDRGDDTIHTCSGIVITTRDNTKEAEIDCDDKTLDCQALPQLDFGHRKLIKMMTIKNCAFNSSLECVMEKLNATGVVAVMFKDMLTPVTDDTFHGADMIEKLLIYNTGVQKSVPVEALKRLPKLTMLRLSDDGVTDVASSTFSGSAPHLEYLEFSLNSISGLRTDAFNGLSNLLTLNLYKNEIVSISDDAFKGLDSLRQLYMDGNQITDLPSTLLRNTPQLRTLTLDLNDGTVLLRSGLVSGLLFLEEIVVHTTKLTLDPGSLGSAPSLRRVDLKGCAITELPPDLFRNSTNIVTLTLTNNNISSLPESLFQGLENLETLMLSDNQLKSLTKNVFLPLVKLTDIYLDNNMLEVLPERLFNTMPLLRKVTLASNRLQTLDDRTFLGASSVKSLDLSNNMLSWVCQSDVVSEGFYNDIVSFQSPLNMLDHLEELNLSHNQLTDFCNDWMLIMTLMKDLNLSYNNITKLTNADINYLGTEMTIDFRHNAITTIELSSYLENKANFKISNNPFICDCHMYRFLQNLNQSFDSRDAYCHQPSSLKDVSLHSLATGMVEHNLCNIVVSLSNLTCPLPDTPEGCACLVRPAVKRTECSCDELSNKTLPDPLNSYPSFTMQLTLKSEQSLSSVPGFVTYLNLSHLGLDTFPDIPVNVTHVNLSNNKLGYVPIEFLRRDLNIALGGNPLKCGCINTDDVANIQSYKDRFEAYDALICDDGVAVYKKDVKRLCDVFRSAVIGGSLAVLGLLLAVTGILVYKYSLKIQIFLFEHGFKWIIKEAMLDANKKYHIFLSYGHDDEDYVVKTLLPKLDADFNVCLHTRDFEIGEEILKQIYRSVADSQRTVIVFSKAFLKSDWCIEEFRAAHNQTALDRRNRAVVVLREDVDIKTLPEDIEKCLGMNTYIRSDDSNFWGRLYDVLPRKLKEEDFRKKKVTEHAVKTLSSAGGLNVINNGGVLMNVSELKREIAV